VDLPTPNAIGTIAMAAGAGKVALVTDNTTLPCGGDCDAAPNVRDFVGYGTTANDFEGAPTPTLTNTTAALRNGGGAVDTDNNLADFTVGTPNPRNTPPTGNDHGERSRRRCDRRPGRQQRDDHVQRARRRHVHDRLLEQRRARLHGDRRSDRVHARPGHGLRARRVLRGSRARG
jgi:hypothetical protein